MFNIRFAERTPLAREYNSLRDAVGWEQLDQKIIKAGLKRSLYSLCALNQNDIIGYCRLVGDGAMKIYIEDLIVLPHLQKKGIGTLLFQHMMQYINRRYHSSCTVGLFASRYYDVFFKRFGFEKCSAVEPGMILNWAAYERSRNNYS